MAFFDKHDFYVMAPQALDYILRIRRPGATDCIGEEFLSRLNSGNAGQQLIDFGCGNGRVSYYVLSKVKLRVLGADFSRRQIRLAKERSSEEGKQHLTEFVVCDLTKPPFRQACFDKLICINVLHHLPNLIAGIRTIKSLLRVGAECLVMEQVVNNPLILLGRKMSNLLKMPLCSGEELFFTDRSLQDALVADGFRIVRKARDGFFLWLFFLITTKYIRIIEKVPLSGIALALRFEELLERTRIINSFGARTVLLCRKPHV